MTTATASPPPVVDPGAVSGGVKQILVSLIELLEGMSRAVLPDKPIREYLGPTFKGLQAAANAVRASLDGDYWSGERGDLLDAALGGQVFERLRNAFVKADIALDKLAGFLLQIRKKKKRTVIVVVQHPDLRSAEEIRRAREEAERKAKELDAEQKKELARLNGVIQGLRAEYLPKLGEVEMKLEQVVERLVGAARAAAVMHLGATGDATERAKRAKLIETGDELWSDRFKWVREPQFVATGKLAWMKYAAVFKQS